MSIPNVEVSGGDSRPMNGVVIMDPEYENDMSRVGLVKMDAVTGLGGT